MRCSSSCVDTGRTGLSYTLTDADTGSRHYRRGQLERAHLVASLRQPDRDGEWLFRFRSRGPFRLPAAGDASVAIGGTLRAVIAPAQAQLTARRGQQLCIPLLFLSPAGHELYSLDSPDGRAAATVVVRTAAGRVIARGKSGFA